MPISALVFYCFAVRSSLSLMPKRGARGKVAAKPRNTSSPQTKRNKNEPAGSPTSPRQLRSTVQARRGTMLFQVLRPFRSSLLSCSLSDLSEAQVMKQEEEAQGSSESDASMTSSGLSELIYLSTLRGNSVFSVFPSF